MNAELLTGQHRVAVRADRKEGRIAQIEESRETHDDVETEREQNESARVGQEIDVGVVSIDEWDERQQEQREVGKPAADRGGHRRYTFSGSASPSKPAGRKIRTSTSTEKTMTLLHC